jgi:hypothetical protein
MERTTVYTARCIAPLLVRFIEASLDAWKALIGSVLQNSSRNDLKRSQTTYLPIAFNVARLWRFVKCAIKSLLLFPVDYSWAVLWFFPPRLFQVPNCWVRFICDFMSDFISAAPWELYGGHEIANKIASACDLHSNSTRNRSCKRPLPEKSQILTLIVVGLTEIRTLDHWISSQSSYPLCKSMSFPTDSQRTIASMKSYELVKKLRQKNIDMKGARWRSGWLSV